MSVGSAKCVTKTIADNKEHITEKKIFDGMVLTGFCLKKKNPDIVFIYGRERKLSHGPEVIKLFSCSIQLSMKFFLLINVKMQTIVGISTFLSRKNSILGLSEP